MRDGGNLVLTDSAAKLLPEYIDLDPKKIDEQKMYLGQLSFQTADGADAAADIKHPLATTPFTVAQLGARFNSGLRRQVYEPVPLGFAIEHPEDTEDNSVGDNFAASPAWDVEREAFEQNPGAKTAATGVEEGPNGSAVELDRTSVGEIVAGKGRVRFIGALAPQPSQEFDHDFGIEPYSLTYTGHLLLRNALEWPARPILADGGPGPGRDRRRGRRRAARVHGLGARVPQRRRAQRGQAPAARELRAPAAPADHRRRVPDVGRAARRRRAARRALPREVRPVHVERQGEPQGPQGHRRLLLRALQDDPRRVEDRLPPRDARAAQRPLAASARRTTARRAARC